MPSPDPQRSTSSFHARFTDKVKMKLLGRSKTTSFSPTITETSVESSSLESSSSSSVVNSQSTSITVPSSQSSTSLSAPVTQRHQERLPLGRPKSEYYSPRRLSTISSTTSSSVPQSPYAPRILSVQENQWVHQSLLLVFGQVGVSEKPCNSLITVHHHLDGYPSTQWPISEGYFKALVRLDPGPNKIRFEYNASKIPSYSTRITLNMLPLATSPPLHLALLLGKDSTGEYECQGERKEHEGNGIEMAQKKLRMAAHLVQAFTAEQMYRNRMGRRCFRLEEEWDFDSLSNRATIGTMRNLAKVHVIRLESTVDEIHSIEKEESGEMLREMIRKAVDAHFGGGTKAAKQYIATVLIDAKGHLQFQGISAHSALSDGIGIVGGHSLYTLPSCIEEVVPSFSNCTRIGGSAGSQNSADPIFFWEAATAVLGVMMEAFLSPQSPIEPRDFSKVNRTFVTKEPYSLKTKSPGLKLSLPLEECSWPRVDCLRFRYHPCFRLPTDPISPPLPDAPQIYAVDNGIVAGASSGVSLVLIYVGDTYRDYIEYTTKPEREVLLQEDFIRSKLPDIHRSAIIKLKVYSAGQGETIVEDFHAARNLKVQLPNGYGSAFKSSSLGPSETADPQSQQVILHSITTGRMLTGIRVFHTSAAWDGLEFLYEDSSSQLFGHRGTTGDSNSSKKSAVSDFTLDARKGESLLGFQLRVCGGRFVDGIEILTSFGRRSSVFGNPQGGSITTLVPPRGRSIAGVSGTCAERVNGFSILYK